MDLALRKRVRDVLERHLPFPIDDEGFNRYDRVATGTAKFDEKGVVDQYPAENWDPNSGGDFNNGDWALEYLLAAARGDSLAYQSGRNKALWLARHLSKQQDAHGQNHVSLILYAELEQDEDVRHEFMAGFFNAYNNVCISDNWKWMGGAAGFTPRPCFRLIELATRFAWHMGVAIKEGRFDPDDDWPDLKKSPPTLAANAEFMADWLCTIVHQPGKRGWILPPGEYIYKDGDEEKRWLFWTQSNEDSEEKHLTPFMLYCLFMGMALWREIIYGREHLRPLRLRRADLAEWCWAVFFAADWRSRKSTGCSQRTLLEERPVKFWTPDQLDKNTERGYHAAVAMIRYMKCTRQEAIKMARSYIPHIKVGDGRIDWQVLALATRPRWESLTGVE